MSAKDKQLELAVSNSKSPYQLDQAQTNKACKTLIKHIAKNQNEKQVQRGKKNLLADGEDSAEDVSTNTNDIPIWLLLTTKKHIVDQKRLKPGKIPLPHSLNTSPTTSICLITADPQRTYKDAIADEAFPSELRKRITRVIGLEKLKAKYKAFEARRQLFAEHDMFLADDRIIIYLPQVLGKVFYKGGTKRPVPVSIEGSTGNAELGQRIKPGREGQRHKVDKKGAANPQAIAREIEKAMGAALVHLAPGTSTAVKVGRADFEAEMLRKNVETVVNGMAEKYVTKGWRNIRAIHIKGPNTMAFPIWLASELWMDEEDILEEKKTFGKKDKSKTIEAVSDTAADGTADTMDTSESKKKRKAEETSKPTAAKHAKKKRKAEVMAAETTERKERLRKQKAKAIAIAEADGSIPLVT